MRSHPTHDVLLVDPALEVRAPHALYLQMQGFRVVEASAADDTLRRLRSGCRPCVVLANPRATGNAAWELVDYLHGDSVLATVPLVLFTDDPVHVRSAHWHGVRECLPTPTTPAGVVAAIRRQCRRVRSDASLLTVPEAPRLRRRA